MLILTANLPGRMLNFPLQNPGQKIVAGALPENNIYLPYQGVSRHHFSISFESSGWKIRDLGSRNGVRLNGKVTQEALLKPGDVIAAGVVEITVKDVSTESLMPIPAAAEKLPSSATTTGALGNIPLQGLAQASLLQLTVPDGMVLGNSAPMLEIYQKVQSLVDSDVNVLLLGETGTGKEMFAQIFHLSGKRKSFPFFAINCAAIPAEMAEAELFGIGEKVATNVGRRKGKMEMANGGTLFLDEISAFPIELQAKILRALEERVIYPVGENRPVRTDFRLIGASNEDPQDLIRNGKLREDLYHRLATVEICIPPLRDRKEDLEPLVLGLLQSITRKEGKQIAGISRNLFSLMASYPFSGNIRELVNILRAMVALAHPGEILDIHLAPGKLLQNLRSPDSNLDLANSDQIDIHREIDKLSEKLILQALEKHDWNISKAAKFLNLTPFGLRKMMKRLGIQAPK